MHLSPVFCCQSLVTFLTYIFEFVFNTARSASNFATLVPQERLKIKYFANFAIHPHLAYIVVTDCPNKQDME